MIYMSLADFVLNKHFLLSMLKTGKRYPLKFFSNIINIFSATFDQFNGSLLNKTINSKNIYTVPTHLNGSVALALRLKHTKTH